MGFESDTEKLFKELVMIPAPATVNNYIEFGPDYYIFNRDGKRFKVSVKEIKPKNGKRRKM